MNLDDKIYIAGHTGLVGSAIVRQLEMRGFKNLLTRTHKELELTNQIEVRQFFADEKPDYVILAAAMVGGIYANSTYPAEFIYNNLMIQSNVIDAAHRSEIKRLLFLGSSCVYPKSVVQPMREDSLLTGTLEPTNEPYAIAKISGIKLCESYNRQHGTDFRSVMPTNLYGINDSFHPLNSHVIPSLIRRIHNAQLNRLPEVVIWGTGKVMREFMFVDDMAEASLFVLELDRKLYENSVEPNISHVNIGTGEEITIRELAETICGIIGFRGNLIFDNTKPDGVKRKLIDNSRLEHMGWTHSTTLKEGIAMTYDWYVKNTNDRS